MRILITGACGVTPRAIARSLLISRPLRGATLIGSDRGDSLYGFYEGLYDRVHLVPDTRDARYPDAMHEICRREAIDVAVISPETEVLYWSQRRDLPVPTLLPSPHVARVAVSKKSLYDALGDSGLIPSYGILTRADLLARRGLDFTDGPVWLRDFSDASSSGMGAIKVEDAEQAYAWACLNAEIDAYMVSEYLPGRNFACCILFHDDRVLKAACYERLDYFMGKLVPSGITGNISHGRLIDDSRLTGASEQAIRLLSRRHNEPAEGLFTVDMREARDGSPKITEINVRHTACTSALAAGGSNLAEAQVLASLGRLDEIGEVSVPLTGRDTILRDIDGPPLLVAARSLEIGDCVARAGAAPDEHPPIDSPLRSSPPE